MEWFGNHQVNQAHLFRREVHESRESKKDVVEAMILRPQAHVDPYLDGIVPGNGTSKDLCPEPPRKGMRRRVFLHIVGVWVAEYLGDSKLHLESKHIPHIEGHLPHNPTRESLVVFWVCPDEVQ